VAESSAAEGIATVHAFWQQQTGDAINRVDFYTAFICKHVDIIESNTGASTADIPVIISGMASASIGMVELPYTALPFSLSGSDLAFKKN